MAMEKPVTKGCWKEPLAPRLVRPTFRTASRAKEKRASASGIKRGITPHTGESRRAVQPEKVA